MVPYVMVGLDCMVLAVGSNMVESLWVRLKRQANKADVIVGVYYKLHSQDDNTN